MGYIEDRLRVFLEEWNSISVFPAATGEQIRRKYECQLVLLQYIEEATCIEPAELKTIRSVWGQFAGIGLNPEDASFIDQTISDCLAK